MTCSRFVADNSNNTRLNRFNNYSLFTDQIMCLKHSHLGLNGLAGRPGLRGMSGTPGQRGAAGEPGLPGGDGAAGDRGTDGTPGFDGQKGKTLYHVL